MGGRGAFVSVATTRRRYPPVSGFAVPGPLGLGSLAPVSNPFFSAGRYPWGREDAIALHRTLGQAITDTNAIAMLFEQADGDITQLNQNQAPASVWRDVLNALSSAGKLQRLCELLENDQRVAAMNDRIRAVFYATSDVELQILEGDVLVLDRANLRTRLGQLESADSPVRVLVIRGETKTGKSRGRYLFQRAAKQRGAQPIYLFAEIIPTVDLVVQQLFSALSALDQIPPRGTTTKDAWYQTVCLKLQSIASEKDRHLWVAIDDLGPGPDDAPLLDQEIRLFCEQLALNTRNPLLGDRLRLMLIHYPDGPMPTKWESDFWKEDRTGDDDVQEKDVREFLRAWAAASRRTLLDEQVETLAEDVIAAADADPPPPEASPHRLQRLNDSLTKTLRELERQAR